MPSSVTLVTRTECRLATSRCRSCSGARSPPHFLCSNSFSFRSNPASTRQGEHSSRCCCTFARFSGSISSSRNSHTSRRTPLHCESSSVRSIGSPQAIAATIPSIVPDAGFVPRDRPAVTHEHRTVSCGTGRVGCCRHPRGPQETSLLGVLGQQFTQLPAPTMQPRHHGPQRGAHDLGDLL